MKLPLAKINEQNDDNVNLCISVTSDLEAFSGHFPGQPVLPGVVQVDWVMRFANMHLNSASAHAQDIKIKFKKIIVPDSIIVLALQIDREKGKLIFTYSCCDLVMSSGQIKLGWT